MSKKQLETQLKEEADSRRKMTLAELDELHRKELEEADLADRMDIDAGAHAEAKEYIQAFADEARHDAGFEEKAVEASDIRAMDVSHADGNEDKYGDEEYELFQDGDEEEPQGKKAGRGRKKSKRRSKKNSRKKSKKITKKSMKKRRKSVRKPKRRRSQYGGLKTDGLSAKLSALRMAVTAGGSAVHTELLRQLILKETDEEVANTLRESIRNPALVHSPPGSLDRYRLSFRAIEKHLFEDRAIEFSTVLGRYILSGVFVVPDDLPEAYLCPISLEMMTDPVMTESGNTYEGANIANWYVGHSTNPLTGAPLSIIPIGQPNAGQPNKRLIPNIALMKAINYKTGRDLYGPPPPPPP